MLIIEETSDKMSSNYSIELAEFSLTGMYIEVMIRFKSLISLISIADILLLLGAIFFTLNFIDLFHKTKVAFIMKWGMLLLILSI